MSGPHALPGFVGTHGAGFASARGRALVALETEGMPTRKTEAFRFTSVRNVLEGAYTPAHAALDPSPEAGAGVTVTVCTDDAELGDAARTRAFTLAPLRSFGAANALAFDRLVHVAVQPGATGTLDLGPRRGAEGQASAVRVFVDVGPGAQLSLVQRVESAAGGLCNDVVELHLAPGAKVDHTLLVDGAGAAFVQVGVEVGADAHYRAVAALVAGAPARLEHLVRLAGERAACAIGSVCRGRAEATLDHHVRTVHAARGARSVATFRAIAEDRSTVVLDAIAEVRAEAPGSDVVQSCKSLLVGRDAAVHCKPHLEIDVDEVTASHGATVGSFDPDALFYLRSRGLSDADARALLTEAFVRAVLDDVASDTLREGLAARVLGHVTEEARP